MKKALLATLSLILIGSVILVAATGSKALKSSENPAGCPAASMCSQSGENCPMALINSPMGQMSSQNESCCSQGMNCPKCADCPNQADCPKDMDCSECPKESCFVGNSCCTQAEQN